LLVKICQHSDRCHFVENAQREFDKFHPLHFEKYRYNRNTDIGTFVRISTYFEVVGRVREKIVYRDDMPKGLIVKLENEILVGTGLNYLKGVEQDEGVLPKTRR
jgi:hypothetical protein